MGTNQRFVVFGTDSTAAAPSAIVHALLPQDVGLLLHGQHLLLDFRAARSTALSSRGC